MANLQDLIKLAEADGGKFFVMDEKGDAKLVIMSVDDYQRLLLGKLQRQVQDVENINEMILKAQLQEDAPNIKIEKPEPKVAPVVTYPGIPRQDLRSEVIDPSFDLEVPKVEIDDL